MARRKKNVCKVHSSSKYKKHCKKYKQPEKLDQKDKAMCIDKPHNDESNPLINDTDNKIHKSKSKFFGFKPKKKMKLLEDSHHKDKNKLKKKVDFNKESDPQKDAYWVSHEQKDQKAKLSSVVTSFDQRVIKIVQTTEAQNFSKEGWIKFEVNGDLVGIFLNPGLTGYLVELTGDFFNNNNEYIVEVQG